MEETKMSRIAEVNDNSLSAMRDTLVYRTSFFLSLRLASPVTGERSYSPLNFFACSAISSASSK